MYYKDENVIGGLSLNQCDSSKIRFTFSRVATTLVGCLCMQTTTKGLTTFT